MKKYAKKTTANDSHESLAVEWKRRASIPASTSAAN